MCLGATSLAWGQSARAELDLGGTWQYQKVTQLNYPPTNTWQSVAVPGFLYGWQYEHAWFRRQFTVPAAMAGPVFKLHFGGVKFGAQVWLNGSYIGTHLNGYEPFELDISSALLPGQPNELIVGVTDWTATFLAPVDFSNLAQYENPRDHVRNNILAPIGGRYDYYGIWQPVKIVSLPAVSIEDVFLMPSVRTQQLTVRLTLQNDSTAAQTISITNRVLDGANVVLAFPDQQVTVPPATNVQVDVAAPWTNAHYWTHLDPYLYTLTTSSSGPAGEDQVQTRFGFREFWVQSGQFFLNGTPINLRASATWPTGGDLQPSNTIAKVLLDVKNGNNVALRLHTQPWDEQWYDVADQVGLLIVEECAVWCDPWAYRLSDTNFWYNYSEHLAAAVKRDRNHPCIVLWSLENEILHCGGERAYSATDAQLAAMGRLVKTADPTRPITYEADLDPGGVADVLGLHYPHEFPDFQVWPNAAYWMDQPIPRDWVPGGQWTWTRAKPLYIGEFLWVPSTSASVFTILFGDDAYTDPAGYRNLAKGLAWQMQIEAYRYYGVNGICPWTMFEDPAVTTSPFDLHPQSNSLYQVVKNAYHPNAVIVKEYNTRFFAGDTVQRTIESYNDRMIPGELTLRWNGGSGSQSKSFTLPAAGHREDTASFQAPATPGLFSLQLDLSEGGSVLFSNSIDCASMPRTVLTLPAGLNLGAYDPPGTTISLLQRFGMPFTVFTNLRTAPLEQVNLLVIGRNALTNDPVPEVGSNTMALKLQGFAERGGWAVVLEQTNYPSWMPAGLQLHSFDASFAFPNPDHPAMQGVSANDLRWWAPDHRLVSKALSSPSRGNFRALAWVGSQQGLEYAAAVEMPIGQGGVLCSQWLLSERFDLEPMAGVLLQRLLNYCGFLAGHLQLRPAALLAETNSPAATRLLELGLQVENFSGRLTNCAPSIYPVLTIAGSNAAWAEATSQLSLLTNFVQQGGKLVLHRPPASFVSAAQSMLFPQLSWSDAALGLVLRREATNAAVRLLNHDLYWIDQVGDWNRPELLSTNVAGRYYRKVFNLASYQAIQAESMYHSTGSSGTGGWWLNSNGYISTNISVTQAGIYLFNIRASGTPAYGGWPLMSLRIDGRSQDFIVVPTNQLAWYTLSADLPAGTHQLAISFDNDAWNPPTEDRNLFLDEIRWGRDADNNPATLLTGPGAVAQVRSGKGLVLLDEIAWDTEARNTTKASRYVSSLLTGLGASIRFGSGLLVEAEAMTNYNVAACYTNNGIVWVDSNGRIEATVRFTASASYGFDFIAGGTAMQGVLPQVALVVDGVNRYTVSLVSSNMTHYACTLPISAGTHRIGLAFLNDAYAPPEDRNAAFDSVMITPPAPPRISSLNPDFTRQLATVQWEAQPAKTYEIQIATSLGPSVVWQALASVTSLGTIASWQDNGLLAGSPPFSPVAPQRFYRIRTW